MSHPDPGNLAPANNQQFDAIAPILDQLSPIRRHRLVMAEQALQRQRTVLDALRTSLAQMAAELLQLRGSQKQQRNEQRRLHSQRRLSLHEINRWLDGEQQALLRIERLEQRFNALQEEYRQQQLCTDDSQKQVRRRQRDIEKLDYMREQSRDAS